MKTAVAYLHSIKQEWAEKAKTYIEECQKTGDFDDLEGYRHARQKYFETEPSVETSNMMEHSETQ